MMIDAIFFNIYKRKSILSSSSRKIDKSHISHQNTKHKINAITWVFVEFVCSTLVAILARHDGQVTLELSGPTPAAGSAVFETHGDLLEKRHSTVCNLLLTRNDNSGWLRWHDFCLVLQKKFRHFFESHLLLRAALNREWETHTFSCRENVKKRKWDIEMLRPLNHQNKNRSSSRT